MKKFGKILLLAVLCLTLVLGFMACEKTDDVKDDDAVVENDNDNDVVDDDSVNDDVVEDIVEDIIDDAFGGYKLNGTGTVTFMAADAVLAGGSENEDGSLNGIRLETDTPNIGYWDKGGIATWVVEVEKAGTYNVKIQYAKDNGATVQGIFSINDQILTFDLPDTTGWQEYVELDCGNFTVAEGVTAILIQGSEANETGLMNLKSFDITAVE